MGRSHAARRASIDRWVPSWAARLGTAVWVVGPDRRIRFVNERAEKLLGVRSPECLGQPCAQVVAGSTPAGRAFCSPRCPAFLAARERRPIPARTLLIGPTLKKARWTRVLIIPVDTPDRRGSCLVHCAERTDREHRLEAYLARLATRSSGGDAPLVVTEREREILELLVADETLHSIALHLQITYTTVRNHVQHIVAKTGAHTTMEAVARYLLRD